MYIFMPEVFRCTRIENSTIIYVQFVIATATYHNKGHNLLTTCVRVKATRTQDICHGTLFIVLRASAYKVFALIFSLSNVHGL